MTDPRSTPDRAECREQRRHDAIVQKVNDGLWRLNRPPLGYQPKRRKAGR